MIGLATAVALATTFTTPSEPYREWVLEAQVPTPIESVQVIDATCPIASASACTLTEAPTIYFDYDAVSFQRRFTFWHELGHRFDYQMPEWARTHFLEIVGVSGPWQDPTRRVPPNELFAEAYANCAARGDVIPGWQVKYVSPSEHRRVCNLIWNVAARRPLSQVREPLPHRDHDIGQAAKVVAPTSIGPAALDGVNEHLPVASGAQGR